MSSEQHSEYIQVLYRSISLICQTLFYGIYAALIPFSSYLLLKKKPMTRANILMCTMTILMFLLSTAFWASSVGSFIVILGVFLSPSPDHQSKWFKIFPLFNSLLLINNVLTDSVVVWRAWVLCRDESRKSLMLTLFLLVGASASGLMTIAVRITLETAGLNPARIIDFSQISSLVLSLITNISATSIIGFRAWQHRLSIRETLSRERTAVTKVEKILVLLVESGVIYCVSSALLLVSALIRLPFGTLGDIYLPVHVQIAGIYPTVVLVLVSQQRSLKEGVFSTSENSTGVVSAQLAAMDFSSNPAVVPSTVSHDEGRSDGTTCNSPGPEEVTRRMGLSAADVVSAGSAFQIESVNYGTDPVAEVSDKRTSTTETDGHGSFSELRSSMEKEHYPKSLEETLSSP